MSAAQNGFKLFFCKSGLCYSTLGGPQARPTDIWGSLVCRDNRESPGTGHFQPSLHILNDFVQCLYLRLNFLRAAKAASLADYLRSANCYS